MRSAPRSKRKRVLLWGAGVLAVITLLLVGGAAFFYTRAVQTNIGELSFATPLAVPPQLEPTVDADGRKVFDLRFVAGTTELVGGRQTETWGLNGTYLAPTLRAAAGDEVVVNVENGVDEPTTLHWHGMHLPAEMDGGPHQLIEPGEVWSPTWAIDQPAATLWFHPHLHGATAEHVYRGAAGMFIVDDPAPTPGLPDEYGVDDIPLILQDKKFAGDGSLSMDAPFLGSVGVLGGHILVNGTHDPHLDVTTELVRFRLLNASNARVYNVGFADDRPYQLVASDAGLLERPVDTTRIQLSPGERAEIVVAMEPGERAILRSHPPDLGTDAWNERFNGGDDAFDLVELRAAPRLDASDAVPARLTTIDRPDESDAVRTRSFELSGREINGRKMDMARIDQVVTVDTTEIWEVTNRHGTPHSFHPHLVHFAVLDIDGRPPPPELAGWKDTIYVPPNTTIRTIARFDDYADPDTPYMFHCHVLAHEDEGMMGQFVVVQPGDEPGDIPTDGHRH